MDLVLVRLTVADPSVLASTGPDPEIVADILWTVALPADRLEHLRVRRGPHPGCVDVALFHRTGHPPATDLAHGLCRRAIATAPFLRGFTAHHLPDAPDLPAARRHDHG